MSTYCQSSPARLLVLCPWLICTSQYCLLSPNYMSGKYLQDWMSCRNSRFRVNVTSSSYVQSNYKEEKQDLIYFPLQVYFDLWSPQAPAEVHYINQLAKNFGKLEHLCDQYIRKKKTAKIKKTDCPDLARPPHNTRCLLTGRRNACLGASLPKTEPA